MKATVVVPTHGDRGPLLPHSVGSVLRQTVEELEVYIMGDGVSEATRATILEMKAKDGRIHFFDNPKDKRRGEACRNRALQDARGEIVCYLCDRDLMLPNHVELLYAELQERNFTHSLMSRIQPDGEVLFSLKQYDLSKAAEVRKLLAPDRTYSLALSTVGHRMDLYRSLPYGWQTTPDGIMTDHYMWAQFLASEECRPSSMRVPTILYFARGYAPSKSRDLSMWLAEFADWEKRVILSGEWPAFQKSVAERAGSLKVRTIEAAKDWLRSRPNLRSGLRRLSLLHRPLLKLQNRLLSSTTRRD